MGVVGRQFVGDEHRVEQAALHGPRHVLPVVRTGEMPADLVLRVAPHAGRMAVHAMLDEAQQMRAFLVLLFQEIDSEEKCARPGRWPLPPASL